MDRTNQQEWYCYLYNKTGEYFTSTYNNLGRVVVTKGVTKTPLDINPSNLKEMQLSFGTNKNYFSGVRALLMNFIFVGDGSDILRAIKYEGRGYAEEVYFSVERFNPYNGLFDAYYEGRLDLSQTKDTVVGYSVPCIDTTAWGILSQNDDVKYAIDCNPANPLTIPVVFDGITLKAKWTYQFIDMVAPIGANAGFPADPYFTVPVVIINIDGDSAGVISQAPPPLSTIKINNSSGLIDNPADPNYIYRSIRNTVVNIQGRVSFMVLTDDPPAGGLEIAFVKSSESWFTPDEKKYIFNKNGAPDPVIENFQYNIDFNFDYFVAGGEAIFLEMALYDNEARNMRVHFNVTNFSLSAMTKADASIVYCRRPLDVVREVVGRATNNQFITNSDFYSTNKNKVLTCGDALRQAPNSTIKTSFRDWFRSYDVEKWQAFRLDEDVMWIEPVQAIYDPATNLFDIGEVKDVEIEDAYDYLCNETELNMNKQDYRRSSGRLEFNALNTFSMVQYNVKNKLSLVSPYRKDCYGMEFIRLDYQKQSTKDNSGDDTVFMVDITDEKVAIDTHINNFLNLEVNSEPLSPIIYFPYDNDIIDNDTPIIRGVCQPSMNFFIYVDGVLDGTSSANPTGEFGYTIQTPLSAYVADVSTGVHTIELTFTDLTGVISARTVTIMDRPVSPSFENVHDGDFLYDNMPLVMGFIKAGTTETLVINGVNQGDITGDGNCRFSFKVPLPNGINTMSIGAYSISFTVNSHVDIPLITSVGYWTGFMPIQDNTPLIRGVALPTTIVHIYLDYWETEIGSATADANGSWAFQVVPLTKPSGDTLTPIPNGNHIISTSLEIRNVAVKIVGFKLNRPAYDDIQGVIIDKGLNTLNTITYSHNAANIPPDGETTLGVSFVSNSGIVSGYTSGNSPYQDLVGFDLATNDDRWILRNESGTNVFRIRGTISVMFGFAETFKWYFQKNNGTIYEIVPMTLYNALVRYDIPFDVTISMLPNEKLFIIGFSENNYDNDKTYYQNNWTMETGLVVTGGYSVFNTELTPKHNLLSRMDYWKSIFYQQPDTVLKFETADKNGTFSTTLAGVTTKENTDVRLSDYPDTSLFYPYIFSCTVETPFFFVEQVKHFASGGLVKFTYQGIEIHCLPIGKMSVEDVSNNVERWSLLVSTVTPLSNIMNLSNSGTIFINMADSVYRSDYNTLHMVRYDHESEWAELHDDWFENRNERWSTQPDYIQKLQTTDILVDQIIANFETPKVISLGVYDGCGKFVDSYIYVDVSPAPIYAPEQLKQVVVDLSVLGEGDFYFMLFADDMVGAISELVSIKVKHYGTILIDAGSPKNKVGTVFSNGFRSKIRIEGLVEKWIGTNELLINEDETGNFDNLKSINTKRRTVLFGNGTGIPDWLYNKICLTILLDDLYIQGVSYVIAKDARIEPVDRLAGYPMYYYSIDFAQKENPSGYAFTEFKPFPGVSEESKKIYYGVTTNASSTPTFVDFITDNFKQDIVIQYTNQPAPIYFWMAHWAGELKTNWTDMVDTNNSGKIGAVTDLFEARTVTFGGNTYVLYITRYKTFFNGTLPTIKYFKV